MKKKSNKKKSLHGTGLLSPEWNFKNLAKLIREKFTNFKLDHLNGFIQQLYTYKSIFSTIAPAQLLKNGFTDNHIKVYKPVIENILIKAITKKSELLDAENLPGQIALFGLGKPFDEARLNNSYTADNIVYNRQQTGFPKLDGKDCDISFALNKSIKGWYLIIDADNLQPSHLGNMQNPLHFIPEAQPRNRATSQSGHNTPKLIAENLRPAELAEGATAYSGAPIVNMRGEVIQGNGRGFTIKYYYATFPEDPKGYKKWLKANLACYDIREDLKKIAKPVLVRMVRVSDAEAIELGQYTAKDLEAVANETTQIKSKVGLISDQALDIILNNLLSKDTGEQSLSELIRASDLLKLLIKENIIRGDDLEVYTRNGIINETGVNFITKLLLNLTFKDGDVNTADVFLQLPVPLQKAIEKSALYILKCRGEQNINLEVSKAVMGLRDYLIFKPNGSINEWKSQVDIFDNTAANKYNDLEIKLISIFSDSPSQKQIVDQFKNYASFATTKPGDMFEDERPPLSKKEAIKMAFGIEINETVDPKKKAIQAAKRLALLLSNESLEGYIQTEVLKVRSLYKNRVSSAALKKFFKENLIGESVVNLETKIKIEFKTPGMSKTIFGRKNASQQVIQLDHILATAIHYLPELLKFGVFMNHSVRLKAIHLKMGGRLFWNFMCKINVDNKTYYLIIPVLETNNKKFQYALEYAEIKKSVAGLRAKR